MKIKVTADSTCDLSKELVEQYDIGIIPLYIVKGDQSLRDGIDIVPEDIYQYVESGAGVCHTTAINVAEYAEIFAAYRQTYDAVVHLNISSEFSACYQNAVLAAQELDNVYVVDSRNLSTGMGGLVLDAAILAQEGMDPADIQAEINRRAKLVEASFVINTLKYLHKGGRCSTVAALGANILNLKPCIEVIDGKMEVGKKYRGNIKNVLMQYVKDRLVGRDDIDYRRIFVTSTMEDPAIVQQVKELVESLGSFQEILVTRAGCTVSNHCGPNTLGILFHRKG